MTPSRIHRALERTERHIVQAQEYVQSSLDYCLEERAAAGRKDLEFFKTIRQCLQQALTQQIEK